MLRRLKLFLGIGNPDIDEQRLPVPPFVATGHPPGAPFHGVQNNSVYQGPSMPPYPQGYYPSNPYYHPPPQIPYTFPYAGLYAGHPLSGNTIPIDAGHGQAFGPLLPAQPQAFHTHGIPAAIQQPPHNAQHTAQSLNKRQSPQPRPAGTQHQLKADTSTSKDENNLQDAYLETWDTEDYPNGNITRRILAAEAPPNWTSSKWVFHSNGFVGKTTTEYRKCQGVICCTQCGALIRPVTYGAGQRNQLSQPCAQIVYGKQCSATLSHFKCKAKLYLWREDHEGRHISPSSQAALQSQGYMHRLGVGPRGSLPLAEIDPRLADAGKARYARTKSLERLGLSTLSGGRSLVEALDAVSALESELPGPFVIGSGFHGSTKYAVFQTPFMAQLLSESVTEWDVRPAQSEGRHGYVTDGDHSYFKTGVLLATCAFNAALESWAPVLFTWIRHQNSEHHRPHFRILFSQILESLQKEGRDLAPQDLLNVVDFSAAQREAFIVEFVAACERMCERTLGLGWTKMTEEAKEAERARFKSDAEKALQGCNVHFRRSALRIKKQAFIIPPERSREFDVFTNKVLQDIARSEFDRLVEELQREFPKTKNWICWWIRPSFAKMIFPAHQTMDAEVLADVPRDSNPVEGQHSLLHHGAGSDHELLPGIRYLWNFAHEVELRYKSIKDGHITPTTPRNPRKSATRSFDPNDGRAPDTIEALGLAQPNRSSQVFESSPLRLQSYQWSNYSCFIDHTLEILFRCFAELPSDKQEDLRVYTPHNSFLSTMIFHFSRRVEALVHPAPNKALQEKYQRELTLCPALARHQIDCVWKLYDPEDGPGAGGCPTQWLDKALLTSGAGWTIQQNFRHRAVAHWTCSQGHSISEDERDHLVFKITTPNVRFTQAITKKSTVTMQDYFQHLIPYRHHGHPTYLPLHKLPPKAKCHHKGCNAKVSLDFVTCLWPSILFVSPNVSEEGEVLDCHIRMTNTFQVLQKLAPHESVSYSVVGRILHHRSGSNTSTSNHFTAEMQLGGRSYAYDDFVHEGQLVPVQDPSLLEKTRTNVHAYVYLRMSEHDSTDYQVEDLEEASSLPVPSSPKESPIEIDDEISPQNPGHKGKYAASKVVFSDKGSSSEHEHEELEVLDDAQARDERTFGQENNGNIFFLSDTLQCQTSKANSCRKASKRWASVSRELGSSIDLEAQIACDLCSRNFHESCVKLNISSQGVPYNDIEAKISPDHFEVAVCCYDCLEDGTWDEHFHAEFVMLKPLGWTKYYPAQIIDRDGEMLSLKWFRFNLYEGDLPNFGREFSALRKTCYSAFKRPRTHYTLDETGALQWPVWLHEEAFGIHSYENPSLEAALEAPLGAIVEVVMRERPHPVADVFDTYLSNAPSGLSSLKTVDYIRAFGTLWVLPTLPGDESLAEVYHGTLLQAVGSPDGTEKDRAIAIARVLLSAVIARHYLGLEDTCDAEILELAYQPEIPSRSAQTGLVLQHHSKGYLERLLTVYERAFLASHADEAVAKVQALHPQSVFIRRHLRLHLTTSLVEYRMKQAKGLQKAYQGFRALDDKGKPYVFEKD
ncbi:hypothetical protein BKA70DRAFT_1419447 [Coprinopsis sp. MPI-PUGE-AT-0042]|nr:hypothetical protein BKA70DRAFT_1419447 [Coprinopsis sp. MPI-PUGE-AT-0042]